VTDAVGDFFAGGLQAYLWHQPKVRPAAWRNKALR
jgi:hypothetical protein